MTPRAHPTFTGPSVVAAALLWTAVAGAETWTESLDAGDQIATAQVTMGVGPLTHIQGTLPVGTDVDLFCVQILDPIAFSASLPCANAQANDLWLFDPTGFGVVHDDGCTESFVRLTGNFVPAAGTYYLAISGNNSEARSGVYPIWEPASSNGARAPDGIGSFAALSHWAGENRTSVSPYEIQLSGCTFCEESVQNLGVTWGRVRALYR